MSIVDDGTATLIFRRAVAEAMRAPDCVSLPDATCREVVAGMTETRASCAVIADTGQRLLGILTEQDIARRIAFSVSPETPVRDVMTAPVRSARPDHRLYEAIARMRRFGHRHMPVVDGDGVLRGMLDLHESLAAASSRLVDRIDRLTHEETVDGLRQVKAAQVELADDLFLDHVPAPEILRLLADINLDIYRRVIEMSEREMAEEGWGSRPTKYCCIVMGSGGRGESYLHPDQDNGFILGDYPDEEHDRIDGWFRELAERMTRRLDRVGMPLCEGYVMATNPIWRKTESQWRAQVRRWIRRQSGAAFSMADIFLDFRGAHGDLDMANRLRADIVEWIKAEPLFARNLLLHDEGRGGPGVKSFWASPFGLFGRFVTETGEPENRGKLSLKHRGTLPLVEGARLFCLSRGIAETSTLRRLWALREEDAISANECDELKNAFATMTQLLLREQIGAFKRGDKVTNCIDPRALSRRERRLLVDAFGRIDDFRARLRMSMALQGI